MEKVYLIKDLARLSGQTVYTLKYYLNIGLIKEVGRSPETNFRYFDDTTLERLKKILPISKVIVETASFDIQKLKCPKKQPKY